MGAICTHTVRRANCFGHLPAAKEKADGPGPSAVFGFLFLKLFHSGGCACGLELCNDLFGLFLGNVLFKHAALFNSCLSFNKAKAGEAANNLDNVDLLGANVLENNVEFGLYFSCGSDCCCAYKMLTAAEDDGSEDLT